MSKTYFEGSACVDGIWSIPYSTLDHRGGEQEGLLNDPQRVAWTTEHDYERMTKSELVALLSWRGCPGWTGRRVDDVRRELRRLDRFAAKNGIKNAIAYVNYAHTSIKELYTSARRRGYGHTDKDKDDLINWLRQNDRQKAKKEKARVMYYAAIALVDREIDEDEFRRRCAAAEENY